MTIAPRSWVHALAACLYLNRKAPVVPEGDEVWNAAIDAGLVL